MMGEGRGERGGRRKGDVPPGEGTVTTCCGIPPTTTPDVVTLDGSCRTGDDPCVFPCCPTLLPCVTADVLEVPA